LKEVYFIELTYLKFWNGLNYGDFIKKIIWKKRLIYGKLSDSNVKI